MGYIGRTPTGSILTSADIADGSISTAKLADTAVSTAKIADDAVTTAKTSGVGIIMADQWRITANTSSTGGFFITSDWERADSDGFGQLGTGMTESSGLFTFPSTGLFLIRFQATYSTASSDAIECNITTTVNGTNFGDAAVTRGQSSGNALGFTLYAEHLFDVTDTSTHKVKFYAASVGSGSYFYGSSDKMMTGATFVRLGDT